ncbi:MAG TPA: ECF transporter S component [Clostridiales bacterium]|nr:ECF transporter S component [Clostridia bacterium]MDD4679652.1 ECF transporter S component [Clostridia bacterium]HCS73320.1 ECF transporter S component [Clostridiales bacterium]
MNKTLDSDLYHNTCVSSWRSILKVDLSTRNLVKIAMLSATAFVLMLLQFPLAAFFPPFLELDVSDVPALLGGFALGPLAGILIELIKNLLHTLISGTLTGGIGELSNFFVGSFLVIPASILYIRNKTKKNAIRGLLAGVISMTICACFTNYYIILPLYSKLFMPMEQIITSSPLAIVHDMKTFILFATIPFNLLKGAVVSVVTLLVYKSLSSLLHK